MLNFYRYGTVCSLALVAVVTAACGDSKSSMNPVAPTAVVVEAAQHSETDAAGEWGTTAGKPNNPGNGNGNGNGNTGGGNGNSGGGNGNSGGGNGNGNGNGKNDPPSTQTPQLPTNTTPTTTKKVEIEGLISAKSGDAITVNGQKVTVPSTCVIRHGNTQFTFSDLKSGDRVHVKCMRTTAGTGVTATDAIASETAGDSGTFRLTRAGGATLLASPLTVTYTLTGTATNGSDYTSVPLTATFPANAATVDVVVTPAADATTEGAESVILTLTTVAPYDLGSPATATVTITDTSNPLVTVAAFDSTASETGPDLGTFRFTRTGSTTASLTVTLTVSGTASNGSDFQALPTTVTFAAGQAAVDLFVVPLADASTEGSETVIVTVDDGATYDVGAPASATVTIAG